MTRDEKLQAIGDMGIHMIKCPIEYGFKYKKCHKNGCCDCWIETLDDKQ